MSNAAIKAALEAAALATIPNSAAAGDTPSATELRRTAAAVAAFLRAMPDITGSVPWTGNSDGMLHTRQTYFVGDLAAAVERAARGEDA